MLSKELIESLDQRGVSVERFENQIKRFETGFPYLKLQGAATPGEGITLLDENTEKEACERWTRYLADGGEVIKMVPASGAASRMFKSLFAFVDGDETEPHGDVAEVLGRLDEFAFFDDLNAVLQKCYGMTAADMIAAGRCKEVISAIISENGLNYGNLPKGLLKFHRYENSESRTPVEEQLVEGAQTIADADGRVRIHFTVSASHRTKFEQKLKEVIPVLEKKTGVRFDVTISEQKPSTDTVAVNPDNTPFMDHGHPVFRPGGHGALIENLNDLDSAVVFIKNIDNVVPDNRRDVTLRYKRVLAGYLIMVHDRIARYLDQLDGGNYTMDDLRQMIVFLHDVLNVRHEKMKLMDDSELALFIKGKLDRPLRVCGMVRNEGEPGGGPYIAFDSDGSTSPQILESNQIDLSVEDNKRMMATATHFNPVDLVCYIKDVHGQKYDLPAHVDPATGFISSKSLHGKPLKALELPGLWNGAMSDWSTVFVEVPIGTFNPVKTVNDLLRPAHRG